MKELQDRQKLKRQLYSIPALIGLLLLAVFLSKGAYNVFVKMLDSGERLGELGEQTDSLRERKASLTSDIDHLGTEAGVLDEIRAKFNATREGENLAVIVKDDEVVATTTVTTFERLKAGWNKFLNLWPF